MGSVASSPLQSLDPAWKNQIPPANTQTIGETQIGVMKQSNIGSQLGADHRGVYLSIGGDSALVPWSHLRVVGNSNWTTLILGHASVDVRPAAFKKVVLPYYQQAQQQGHDKENLGGDHMQVIVPVNGKPGDILQAQAPSGLTVHVAVPEGSKAGIAFLARLREIQGDLSGRWI